MISLSDLAGFDAQKPVHAYLIIAHTSSEAHRYASLLACALMCLSKGADAEPCLECASCNKILEGIHPDVTFLGKEKVSVDDIRAVRNMAYMAPHESDRKIFVLEGVENFNTSCQNALLKILEEPPRGVVFILSALSKSGVLPTVLSRVCTLTVSVKTKGAAERTAAEICGGSSDSEKIRKTALYLDFYEDSDENAFPTQTVESAYSAAVDFFSLAGNNLLSSLPKTKDELQIYLRVLMLTARCIAAYKLSGGKESVGTPLDSAEFRKMCARVTAKRAVQCYDIFEKAYVLADEYANMNALFAYLAEQL